MNKKSIIALVVLMIGGAAAIYFYLGGLNKVDITLETVSDYNLVGQHYTGSYDSDTLQNAFFEARDLVTKGQLDGILTMLHYKDTTLKEDHIKVFVGIKLNAGTSNLPSHYQRLTVPARRAVRATIEAHNSVMPNSETIEERLQQKGEELNLELQDFTIEQYLGERELMIDLPVRQ